MEGVNKISFSEGEGCEQDHVLVKIFLHVLFMQVFLLVSCFISKNDRIELKNMFKMKYFPIQGHSHQILNYILGPRN
jgi:hypothetical protein